MIKHEVESLCQHIAMACVGLTLWRSTRIRPFCFPAWPLSPKPDFGVLGFSFRSTSQKTCHQENIDKHRSPPNNCSNALSTPLSPNSWGGLGLGLEFNRVLGLALTWSLPHSLMTGEPDWASFIWLWKALAKVSCSVPTSPGSLWRGFGSSRVQMLWTPSVTQQGPEQMTIVLCLNTFKSLIPSKVLRGEP